MSPSTQNTEHRTQNTLNTIHTMHTTKHTDHTEEREHREHTNHCKERTPDRADWTLSKEDNTNTLQSTWERNGVTAPKIISD